MNEELENESTLSSEAEMADNTEIELMSTSDTDISLVDLEGTLFQVDVNNMDELNNRMDELIVHIQTLEETIKTYTEKEYTSFFSADVNTFSVSNTLLFMIFLLLLFNLIYRLIGGKNHV